MKQFKDKTGKRWMLELTIASVRSIKAKTEIDLTVAITGGKPAETFFTDLASNLFMVGDLLWAMCEGQADGIDAEQFAGRFDGDTLAAAATALREEVIDFFDKFRQHGLLAATFAKIREMGEAAEKRIRELKVEVRGRSDGGTEGQREVDHDVIDMPPAASPEPAMAAATDTGKMPVPLDSALTTSGGPSGSAPDAWE